MGIIGPLTPADHQVEVPGLGAFGPLTLEGCVRIKLTSNLEEREGGRAWMTLAGVRIHSVELLAQCVVEALKPVGCAALTETCRVAAMHS